VVFTNNTKSRKYRYVPLAARALEAIQNLPRLDNCPYVFYNPKIKDRWKECRKAWEKARESVGFPHLQVKDLRRHSAAHLAENGADMHDIQQVLGHASVVTTEEHYAQFSPRHSARKVLRVLEGGNKTDTSVEMKNHGESNLVEVVY
jgi:integrase